MERNKIKIGYYPVLDGMLCMRQLFSVERFKPYTEPMEWVDKRTNVTEREKIDEIGSVSSGWLDAISNTIDIVMKGTSTIEETFIEGYKYPDRIFGENGTQSMVEDFLKIYMNHCSTQRVKYSKEIIEKSLEISEYKNKEEIIDYVLSLSDRIERDGESLKFNIKPSMKVRIDEIQNIIIMPSVFASRNIVFWYSGDTFLFYVGLNSRKMNLTEPSDMLLLRTLAFNDKTRLKMMRALSQRSMSVNDMAEELHINPSTVSRHFKVFKDTGYVDIQKQEGNSIYYSIQEEEVKKSLDRIYNYIFEGEIFNDKKD